MKEEPLWAVMFAFSRINAARRIERFISWAGYKSPKKVEETVFTGIDLENVVQTLISDGVYLGLRLPTEIVEEVRTFAEANQCFTKSAPDEGFLPSEYQAVNQRRDRDMLAAYYFEGVERCPAIMRLRDDAALASIASAYLGEPAVLMRTRLWWSFPGQKITDKDLHMAAQNRFHFDIDGWRTLKFFFYLTPTGEEAGPHQFIRSSHRRRRLKHQFTPTTGQDTAQLRDFYSANDFVTITGDPGYGFAEDPFVFHTGSLCQDQPRLMLEIGFGVSAANPAYKKTDFVYGKLG